MKPGLQKRIAAEILKCGKNRVRIRAEKDVEEALTREDIRNLISQGLIYKVQKSGSSKSKARQIKKQKARGRRRGHGTRKGRAGARTKTKWVWIGTVRALRRLLYELRENGQIERTDYRRIYKWISSGRFRSRRYMLSFLKDRDMLRPRQKRKAGPAEGKEPGSRRARKRQAKHKVVRKTKTKRSRVKAKHKVARKERAALRAEKTAKKKPKESAGTGKTAGEA